MLPDKIAPMLLMASEPFDDENYIYEVKWDGWRCLAFLEGETRLQSRNFRNLNATFPDLLEIGRKVDGKRSVLDGEVITFLNGKPNFFRLQHRALRRPTQRLLTDVPVVYVAFDLLYFNGKSLMDQPLEARRELLKKHVHWDQQLQLSQIHEGSGTAFFGAVSDMDLEGIVAKKRNSLYYPGKRSPYWLKCKTIRRSIFHICGYFTSPGKLTLALANPLDEAWGFWGFVSSGITERSASELIKLLATLQTDAPLHFAWPVTISEQIQWVLPELQCEVEYLEITPGLRLRHPVWIRLTI